MGAQAEIAQTGAMFDFPQRLWFQFWQSSNPLRLCVYTFPSCFDLSSGSLTFLRLKCLALLPTPEGTLAYPLPARLLEWTSPGPTGGSLV